MASDSPKGILIKLDAGLRKRLAHEQAEVAKTLGRAVPRTIIMRELLVEALNARALARNEDIPYALPVSADELNSPVSDDESGSEPSPAAETVEAAFVPIPLFDAPEAPPVEAAPAPAPSPVVARASGPMFMGANVRMLGVPRGS